MAIFITPGGGSPGGSDTQIQFNDNGAFGGDVDLTYNKTTNRLTTGGDIELNDGVAGFTTTLQCVTPTVSNKTISLPDATGTVALVAGSTTQLIANQSGAYAGVANSVVDNATGNVTLGGLSTFSGSPSANNTSGVLVSGTWRTGASSNNPQFLINPSATTLSTTWSTSGTGLGVNAPSAFAGNLLDLQVNGTTVANISAGGASAWGGTLTAGSAIGGNSWASLSTEGLRLSNSRFVGWSNGNSAGNTLDLSLFRDTANTLAQRNGTNAQTFRCYGTYTDGSNYVRAALSSTSTAVTLAAETDGTGADDITLNLTAAGTGTVKVNSNLEITDAKDIVLATTTGTKIGTATTQKLGFFGATPVVQQTELTDELTTITHTAPGTPDYAIQNLVDSAGGSAFGFASADEGNTVLSVIANLQTRVNELETKLVALGLLADAD